MSHDLKAPPRALSVAGSDPSGGAGLQADMAVFSRLGVHPMGVTTAITVQNSQGVSAIQPVDADLVSAQLRALITDMPPNAAKTGMLATADAVRAVSSLFAGWPPPFLVVDPIHHATGGRELLSEDGFDVMAHLLFPHATLITPNRYEAERLWGRPVATAADAEKCAADLRELGPKSVLLTGGHLEEKGFIVDTLADAGGITTWRHPRHPGPVPHGTGCALSAAITANLALGTPLRESVRRALTYVIVAVKTAAAPGKGRPYLGDGSNSAGMDINGEFQ